jgi:hypothetical protein
VTPFEPGTTGIGTIGDDGIGPPADGTRIIGTVGGSAACEINAAASTTADAESPTSAK